jgi:hypothetical protein
MKQRTYAYVGPKRIVERVSLSPRGVVVERPEDLLRWIEVTKQELDHSKSVTATFVVDELDRLWVADRRSEHVVCAGGRPVRSAGEISFTICSAKVHATWVTNQSTGYCPEPESWPAVATALQRAGIESPTGFHQQFIFRRCPECGSTNIVKDQVFECGVCSATLPASWNFSLGDMAEPTTP